MKQEKTERDDLFQQWKDAGKIFSKAYAAKIYAEENHLLDVVERRQASKAAYRNVQNTSRALQLKGK